MEGAGSCSGGQAEGTSQSKSLGHSTLNENWTEESRGSNPEGVVTSSAELTMLSVYSEKSPAVLVRRTMILFALANAAKNACSAAVAGGTGTDGAGNAQTQFTGVTRTPPSMRKFDSFSEGFGCRK